MKTLWNCGRPWTCVTTGQRNLLQRPWNDNQFPRYKVFKCAAIQEFYSLLRSTIISVKTVGLIKMLIYKQQAETLKS